MAGELLYMSTDLYLSEQYYLICLLVVMLESAEHGNEWNSSSEAGLHPACVSFLTLGLWEFFKMNVSTISLHIWTDTNSSPPSSNWTKSLMSIYIFQEERYQWRWRAHEESLWSVAALFLTPILAASSRERPNGQRTSEDRLLADIWSQNS